MNISPATYTNYQPAPSSASTTQNIAGLNPQKSLDLNPVESTEPTNPAQKPQENTPSNPEASNTQATSAKETTNGRALDQNDMRLLEELKKIDTQTRQHEMAHIAAGGKYITSGATFSYQRGPDGKSYAVGGEVGIDTSPVPGDPQATAQKMRQIKSAALAPANPSSQDLKVAASATSAASKALSELMILQAKEQASTDETKAFNDLKKASDSYQKVNTLPEGDASSFRIAV